MKHVAVAVKHVSRKQVAVAVKHVSMKHVAVTVKHVSMKHVAVAVEHTAIYWIKSFLRLCKIIRAEFMKGAANSSGNSLTEKMSF